MSEPQTIDPLTAKPLDPEDRLRLFYLYTDEILDSFAPEDYRRLLEYVMWLEMKAGMNPDNKGYF
jgi:hypothetical protein